jgi:Mrp family chromosome partitioning ATPase
MGKYYQAIRLGAPEKATLRRAAAAPASATRDLHAMVPQLSDSGALVPRPVFPDMPGTIAKVPALRNLSERVAPQAVVDNSMRLLVSGCAAGEGTSTIAAALAIDLSQRLNVRTLIVDANLRSPTLHRVFEGPGRASPAVVLNGALQIQATSWPRLDLANCCIDGDDAERIAAMQELEELITAYPATIVDLGVVRLDARTLPLARVNDPIILVVRRGLTKRSELSTSSAALRAANRGVAGVIFNGAAQSAKPGWRLFEHE